MVSMLCITLFIGSNEKSSFRLKRNQTKKREKKLTINNNENIEDNNKRSAKKKQLKRLRGVQSALVRKRDKIEEKTRI